MASICDRKYILVVCDHFPAQISFHTSNSTGIYDPPSTGIYDLPSKIIFVSPKLCCAQENLF